MSDQMFQQIEMKNDIRNFILFIPSALAIMALIAAVSGVIVSSATDVPIFEREHTQEAASLTR